MKRLAVVHHIVSAGGVERLVHALLGALAASPAAEEWEVTLLTVAKNSAGAETQAEESLPEDVTVLQIGAGQGRRPIERMLSGQRVLGIPGTGRLLWTLGRVIERIRSRWLEGGLGALRREIEVVFKERAFDVAYFPYPYFIRPPKLDCPMVGTFHDFNHHHTETLPPSARAGLRRQMPQWLKRCDRIIVSAAVIRTELQQLYPGLENKTSLIRPSFPFPQPHPSLSQLQAFRRDKDLPERFVLTTGWMLPHKNQLVVFQAISAIRAKGSDISLVCVGPNSSELQPGAAGRSDYVSLVLGAAKEGGLDHRNGYLALGYVNNFELESLYRLALAVVIPAVYEAGSFTGLEAMRAGCPVVFSRTPANLEQAALVDDNAWMFDTTDADSLTSTLEEIILDPEKATERAERAATQVRQNLSWRHAAGEYQSVFEAAADGVQKD